MADRPCFRFLPFSLRYPSPSLSYIVFYHMSKYIYLYLLPALWSLTPLPAVTLFLKIDALSIVFSDFAFLYL